MDCYPPFYPSGIFAWSSPLFYIPTLILCYVSFIGTYRYVTTRQFPWEDISNPLVSPSRRLSALSRFIIALACLVTLTYLADTFVIVTKAILESTVSVMLIYYTAISFTAWSISLMCLIDESHKFFRWCWLQYTYFGLAVIGDTVVGRLWALGVYKPRPGAALTVYDQIMLGIFIVRYITEIFVFLLSIVHLITRTPRTTYAETEPLLSSSRHYGATDTPISTSKGSRTYADYYKDFLRVMPFIWPQENRKLQNFVILSFLLMCVGLTINVFTPLQIGKIVDSFNNNPQNFAWAAVLAYVGLKFLQGQSGLIQAAQNWLWIPVGQYTTRKVSVQLFDHLHSLSLNYHINRKTGEILRVVDRGTNSIVQLLSQIVFSIFPALASILIAVVVFSVKFSLPFGAIVFVTMSLYLYVTITLTEWRSAFRRTMNELDNYARTKAVDSLLNFETVKYYNAESFEVNRYDKAIIEYQKADFKNSVSLNILNLAQNAVITAGLLAGSLLFAWEVSRGKLTAGDFVSFNVYMMQLYTPLHFFGTYYRMIQQNFIDMEKMFDLFDVDETVKDQEDAGDLVVSKGKVEFRNVTFTYDNRQTALNGISFEIPKGATVALVGPSGGGKSTILRLLFRFYDPNSGHILIDGQDIAGVKQASLRRNIGVVPQDTVLFNDTILYNIRYGNLEATDEEVFSAAKAAQIHDKILSFPDGYETKVGERGLRLSGGEKQRVAIARTILKNPPIILLDEATSALDTTTERQIQEALSHMTKDRTTLVIAHRLSTIVNADLILVIKNGQVVEYGSHDQLIQNGLHHEGVGVYYDMWQKQLDDPADTVAVSPDIIELSVADKVEDKIEEQSHVHTIISDEVYLTKTPNETDNEQTAENEPEEAENEETSEQTTDAMPDISSSSQSLNKSKSKKNKKKKKKRKGTK
ncbi:hypothetical protein BDB01DRAFT_851733 [Pilobolus umbonatus]|nr:hypothetical protein BDB01DRAFT_851733 [Pilobolus umbonatus]